MATIAEMRTAVNAALDVQAGELGETTELDQESLDLVSYGVDEVNETVNPNLPPRPHG